MTSPFHGPKRSLDDLLGQDLDPTLGQDAAKRLRQRLAEARAKDPEGSQSSEDAELYVVLAFDSVKPPVDLAERVIARVRAEEEANAAAVLMPFCLLYTSPSPRDRG